MSIKDEQNPQYVGEKKVLDSIVLSILETHGWKLEDGTAIASKEYISAVGFKQALVYSTGDGTYYTVSANYQSKGNNILSTTSVFIQIPLNTYEVQELAATFAKEIDAIVAESYAVRLHRLALEREAKV